MKSCPLVSFSSSTDLPQCVPVQRQKMLCWTANARSLPMEAESHRVVRQTNTNFASTSLLIHVHLSAASLRVDSNTALLSYVDLLLAIHSLLLIASQSLPKIRLPAVLHWCTACSGARKASEWSRATRILRDWSDGCTSAQCCRG